MANTRISSLDTITDPENLYVTGIDLTRSVGHQNVKISTPDLVSGATAGTQLYVETHNGITLLGDSFALSPLITPDDADPADVFLEHLEIGVAALAGGYYDFEIYCGTLEDPHGSTPIYKFSTDTGSSGFIANNYIQSVRFILGKSLFLPFSFAGSNNWYIQFLNQSGDPTIFNIQAVYSKFDALGAELVAGYEDPDPYSGPLFDDVYVGPTRTANTGDQYTEPMYAMSAIADGGTMHVDAGRYYRVFGVANTGDTSFAEFRNFGSNTAQLPAGAARFSTGITISGAGTLGAEGTRTIFNGQGGVGNGHRLTFGKAFVYCRAPVTFNDIQFINCGGADGVGDGEAAIYPEAFLVDGNLTVNRCAFDGNEQGVFAPFIGGGGLGLHVSVYLNYCDFGYEVSNAQARDGFSHDVYLQCNYVFIDHCNFYGCEFGNQVKCRSPNLTITNSYIRAVSGRCIDYPDGGALNVSDTILDQRTDCNGNYLAYANEGLEHTYADPVFTDCTLRINRFDTAIWMLDSDPDHKFVFIDPILEFYQGDSIRPTIIPTRAGGTGIFDDTVVVGFTNFDPGGIGTWPVPPAPPAPASWP